MAKRKKHIKTDYEKDRKKCRNGSPRHVVQFETTMTENQKRHAFAVADMVRRLGNQVKHTMSNRLNQMKRTSKEACDEAFSAFIVNMEALIAQIKASGYKICNSGI